VQVRPKNHQGLGVPCAHGGKPPLEVCEACDGHGVQLDPDRLHAVLQGREQRKLTLKTEGDRHVVVTRRFAASPEAVFHAHIEPKLIQKWLLGPEGWSMPVCVIDPRPGGKFRYEWSNGKGKAFHITGEFVEVTPFNRIVHIERMHLPDPTPDNHVVTTFESDSSGTLMIVRMTLPDAAARAAMLATGMEHGMEASYARLDAMA